MLLKRSEWRVGVGLNCRGDALAELGIETGELVRYGREYERRVSELCFSPSREGELATEQTVFAEELCNRSGDGSLAHACNSFQPEKAWRHRIGA